MNRRDFLKWMGKGATAAAGGSILPTGVTGNILKSALGGSANLEQIFIDFFQPERYLMPGGNYPATVAGTQQVINRLKNNYLQIFNLLALKNPALKKEYEWEYNNVLDYVKSAEDVLHNPNAETALHEGPINHAMAYLTHVWDDRQTPMYDDQVAHTLLTPSMRETLEQKYNLDVGSYGIGDKPMTPEEVKQYVQKSKQQQIDREKDYYSYIAKDIDYSRMDKAGGSEDEGYAITYEKFFIENYADGKKPGRKGLAKRSGVNCKQSVPKLRKIAKNSTGERRRMAHWCANMKAGKRKKR